LKPSRIVESESPSVWSAIALIAAATVFSSIVWYVVLLFVLYGGHG
jgi:hypothetical protein